MLNYIENVTIQQMDSFKKFNNPIETKHKYFLEHSQPSVLLFSSAEWWKIFLIRLKFILYLFPGLKLFIFFHINIDHLIKKFYVTFLLLDLIVKIISLLLKFVKIYTLYIIHSLKYEISSCNNKMIRKLEFDVCIQIL